MPSRPEKHARDYFRHGSTSLFAAGNAAERDVIAFTHRWHSATGFNESRAKPDQIVPSRRGVNAVGDAYGTYKRPAVKTCLDERPQFHKCLSPRTGSGPTR